MFNKGDKVLVTGHCYGKCSSNVKNNYNSIVGMIGTVQRYQRIDGTGKCVFTIEGKPNPNASTGFYYLPDEYLELVEAETKNYYDIGMAMHEAYSWLLEDDNKVEEREDIKMKTIRNEEVVKLYFERKNEEINKEFNEKKELLVKEDPNEKFIEDLRKNFDEKVLSIKEEISHEDEREIYFRCVLPLTKDTKEKVKELNLEYDKKREALRTKEKEVRAMLSGCETYEQEMVILNSYKIVSYNNGEDAESKMK